MFNKYLFSNKTKTPRYHCYPLLVTKDSLQQRMTGWRGDWRLVKGCLQSVLLTLSELSSVQLRPVELSHWLFSVLSRQFLSATSYLNPPPPPPSPLPIPSLIWPQPRGEQLAASGQSVNISLLSTTQSKQKRNALFAQGREGPGTQKISRFWKAVLRLESNGEGEHWATNLRMFVFIIRFQFRTPRGFNYDYWSTTDDW